MSVRRNLLTAAGLILFASPLSRWITHRPPERESTAEEAGESAEYELLRRSPDSAPIPIARYHQAVSRMQRMGRYSTASRRRLGANSTKPITRDLSLGAWTQLGPGNYGGRTRALLIHPQDVETMYVAAVAGGIWRTTNGGQDWSPLGDFLPFLSVSTLAMDPRDPAVIYAGTGEAFLNGDGLRGGGLYRTTDGGETWNLLSATSSGNFQFTQKVAVSPVDSRRLYAATNAGLMVSADAGDTWTLAIDRRAPNTGCHDVTLRTDLPRDYVLVSCGISRIAIIGATNRNLFGTTLDLQSPGAIFLNTDAAGSSNWESILSDPKMSRVSLAFAPSNQDVVYALASSNQDGEYRDGLLAVYRSTSGGAPGSWEARVRNTNPVKLNTYLLTNANIAQCSAATAGSQGSYDNVIAVDPLNPNIVWTGGIDLMRSEDGGANWGLASFWWSDTSAHADHHSIVFHPGYNRGTNQTVFDTSDGGVYRTDNALATTATGVRAACAATSAIRWRSLNNSYSVAQFYHGSVLPGGHIYVGGLQDNGTVAGGDGRGINGWSKLNGGDGTFAHYAVQDPASLYVSTPGLGFIKSTDGGANFTSATRGISEPASGFLFNAPFLVDANEPGRLWTGGLSLWRSIDAAVSWQQAGARFPEGNISAIAVSPNDPNLVLAGTSRGWIHRNQAALTSNAESVWSAVQPRLGFVSSIRFDAVDPLKVYATYSTFLRDPSEAHIYRSRDGGVSWEAIDGSGEQGIPDVPVLTLVINPSDSNVLYAGTDLGVFVSLDGGASWLREEMGVPYTSVYHLAVSRAGPVTWLFAFTHGRGVWRVPLSQTGPACAYNLSTASMQFPAAGGTASITIDTAADCPWSAFIPGGASGLNWVSIDRGATGRGPGAVQIRARSANDARSGIIYVADKAYTVSQTF